MRRRADPPLSAEDCFHPETKEEGLAAGFWSVTGGAMCPTYRVTLLGKTAKNRTRVVEYRGFSASELAERMTLDGWGAPPLAEVARLCESAPSSSHIVKDLECKRFKKDRYDSDPRLGEIDHITPVVFGGECSESNLRLLCKGCNRTKAAYEKTRFAERAA